MVVDAHCHLCFKHFRRDVENVVRRAEEAGVERMYDCGVTPETIRRSLEISERFDSVVSTAGLHPPRAPRMPDGVIDETVRLVRENADRLAAVGEIGLDYHYIKDPEERRVMRSVFERFLELAEDLGKPVVIHAREAEKDAFVTLTSYSVVAMFHCYDGPADLAEAIVEEGHYVSLSTIHCIRGGRDSGTRKLLEKVPLEGMLVETDSPYLSPVKGERRNEPANVWRIVELVAEVKGMGVEEVADVTSENAVAFYDL